MRYHIGTHTHPIHFDVPFKIAVDGATLVKPQ